MILNLKILAGLEKRGRPSSAEALCDGDSCPGRSRDCLGDFLLFSEQLNSDPADLLAGINRAASLFYLNQFDEAEKSLTVLLQDKRFDSTPCFQATGFAYPPSPQSAWANSLGIVESAYWKTPGDNALAKNLSGFYSSFSSQMAESDEWPEIKLILWVAHMRNPRVDRLMAMFHMASTRNDLSFLLFCMKEMRAFRLGDDHAPYTSERLNELFLATFLAKFLNGEQPFSMKIVSGIN